MSATEDLGTTSTALAPGLPQLTEGGVPPRALTARLFLGERLVGPVAGIACLVVVGMLLTSGTYLSTIFEDILIFAIAAMGIDLLGGYGGLISLGQAGFIGAGAYGVAISEQHGYSAWAAVGISLAAVLGLALVTGVVAVRVSGITFVIVTLAVGQIFWGLCYQWTALTGGDNGITVANMPSIGPWSLANTMPLWITTLVVFLVVMAVLMLIVRSPFGLSLQGMRANEPRLRALGYRTAQQRYVGYLISSVIAGIAGILYVFSNHLVSPANLTFSQDGFLVLMVVLGGLGTIWGPCIGAVVVVMFQQEISTYVTRWETLMGVVFIAVVIFTPGGIAGILRKLQLTVHRLLVSRHDRARGPTPALTPPPGDTIAGGPR
ncbi:MAG: branched-chain amino acid ABC transporter permease [Actinomycetota bacterium]|jgi:branched-chain amino acid transport system permease protein|nr:branched-chain amino acid ABC transporter permease [Actinomycetota bacterium]